MALFAAGGGMPLAALQALTAVADVVVLVRSSPPPGLRVSLRHAARRLLKGRTPPDALSTLAKDLSIPEQRVHRPDDPALAPFLRSLRVDLACVATFAWRLRPDVLTASRLGTINTHASILPRHRGSNPWFWIYHSDDREAGVTVHICDESLDTGPILRQSSWPLARGYPVGALHRDVAARGAQLLTEAVTELDRGVATATPQDEMRATCARRVPRGRPMVDPAWTTERTWHFLAGMAGHYAEPLECRGAPVRYARVPGFQYDTPRAAPGTVERVDGRSAWRLWCPDGYVQLESDLP